MNLSRLRGLIAATYTPFASDGRLNLNVIGAITDHLVSQGVSGLYVCGSTGEGMSLSTPERMAVAEAYVRASSGRVPVIVQVGHNSVADASELSRHAQTIGADVISATCPSYFSIGSEETLAACMAEIAGGAPDLPFYYYHIPALTGSTIDITEFLTIGTQKIPNLVGLKYTDTKLFEFQYCMELDGGRFDVVWGCDEMLLGAVATGARAAIGSTYNIAAPLYQRIIHAFETGDLTEARRLQSLSVNMIRILARYPFHSAMKVVLGFQGLQLGQCRLPQESMSAEQENSLRHELERIGFFDWSRVEA